MINLFSWSLVRLADRSLSRKPNRFFDENRNQVDKRESPEYFVPIVFFKHISSIYFGFAVSASVVKIRFN